MKFNSYLSVSLAAAVVSAQGGNGTAANLTSLLASNPNLSALTALLGQYPDVAATLAGLTNVTIFAPDNDALNAATQSPAFAAAAGNPNFVKDVLTYHVVPGEIFASDITSTPAFAHTLLNDTTYSNVTGGQVVDAVLSGTTVEIISGLKSVANVTQANLNYTGGVVHIIDAVLNIPSNVSTTALAANLTALVGAVEATNLTDILDTASDITIFAPTNDAFQAIASATGNLSLAQLAGILEYHVINGTVAYSSSLTNGSVTTLSGQNLTITIEDGAVFVNSARVINADVLVSGGVVHVIDSVLNPNATSVSIEPSGTPTAYSGASSGASVPFTSGVPTPSATVPGLATTETAVASGYAPASTGALASGSAGASGSATASAASGAAAMPTAAIGAAALFGGAAMMANW